MWGKLIISQIFSIPAAYVSAVAWSSLFGSIPFIVPLATWVLTSIYVIAKL